MLKPQVNSPTATWLAIEGWYRSHGYEEAANNIGDAKRDIWRDNPQGLLTLLVASDNLLKAGPVKNPTLETKRRDAQLTPTINWSQELDLVISVLNRTSTPEL